MFSDLDIYGEKLKREYLLGHPNATSKDVNTRINHRDASNFVPLKILNIEEQTKPKFGTPRTRNKTPETRSLVSCPNCIEVGFGLFLIVSKVQPKNQVNGLERTSMPLPSNQAD